MTTITKTPAEIVRAEYGAIVGKRVLDVRPLTAAELSDLAWDDSSGTIPLVIFFEDGKALIPSMDPEGNGPGHLFIDDWKRA